MEGMMIDPAYHIWSADDKPATPFIECISSYLGLKGKKKDGLTLEYVRPLRVNMAGIGIPKFDDAVDELIRRINQAGHPNAVNSAGGSAFNPPTLFANTIASGSLAGTSTDTGSHMGHIRAFKGGNADSRDGESGTSIVIHCTIPSATGRNFAVWFNNRSPYPYTPTQVVGHGGLIATNSRSYQTNSFPAPLPLGMDGETHIPITTFQGGAHGAVENQDGELRTYQGIGQDFAFNTVKFPRQANNFSGSIEQEPLLPDYNAISQPYLWVERKALDIQQRTHRTITAQNPGLILVDNKYLATFDGITTAYAGLDAKSSGIGAACALINVQSLDLNEADKLGEVFYDKAGIYQRIPIKLLEPLIDTNGILFFGGGHTGVTFDVSDGTDNDYSNFYTHHYAKGPTGYTGFQNLQEIQTSAAVLDFTEIKNEDTTKDNSYAGMHHKDDDCIMYLRMNKNKYLGADTSGTAGPTYPTQQWYSVENKFGLPLGLSGGWTRALCEESGFDALGKVIEGDIHATDAAIIGRPLYLSASNHGDISARGVLLDVMTNFAGISLTKIADKSTLTSAGAQQALPTSPPDAKNIVAHGPWSITFCVKPNDTGEEWAVGTPMLPGFAHGNGPILQGIDSNGFPWGVSFYTRQHDQASDTSDVAYNYRVVIHHRQMFGNAAIVASYTPYGTQGYYLKDDWMQVTVVKPLNSNPLLYIDGVAITLAHAIDEAYVGNLYPLNNNADYAIGALVSGFKHPRLSPALGIGLDATPEVNYGGALMGRHYNLILIGAALHCVPTVTDAAFNGAAKTLPLTHENSMVNMGALTYGQTQTGGDGTGTGNRVHFKGRLAEIGLWKKALSVSEAATIGARNWD